MKQLWRRQVSRQRQGLLELMQAIGHGQIEHLDVRDREPILEPLPDVVYHIKFHGENGPRPELGTADFQLKSEVIELFDYFDQAGDCHIDVLVIKHGLPFLMTVRCVAA